MVSIDGVAAMPTSWCWVTTCADGMPGPDTPAIASARELSIGAQVSEVGVTVQGADLGDTADVALNGAQIGPIPPGGWEYLVVFARFGVGRDAFYYWRLP